MRFVLRRLGFFLVTLCLSLPGVLLLGWQSLRGLTTRTAAPDG